MDDDSFSQLYSLLDTLNDVIDQNDSSSDYNTTTCIDTNSDLPSDTPSITRLSERSDSLWLPDILVLGPGGAKGFLELGALLKLHKINFLRQVHTYVGCSIGAVISLLLTCGYSPTEIVSCALDADIFHDITTFRLMDVKDNIGLISNQRIRNILIDKLKYKFGFVPTLNQLYLATGLKYVAVTLNLDKDSTEYLSYQTEPDLCCVEATLLSMNIPFLFYKLKYKGCTYIDGAFGNPYPIDIYDNGSSNILGIYISSTHPIIQESSDINILRYLYKVIHSSMNQIKLRIQKSCSNRCKHIGLYSPSLDTTGLTFDDKLKAKMLTLGYNEAESFLVQLGYTTSLNSYSNIISPSSSSSEVLSILNPPDSNSSLSYFDRDDIDFEPDAPDSTSSPIFIPITPKIRARLNSTRM